MEIRRATKTDIPQLTQLKKPKSEEYRKIFAENQQKRLCEMEEGKAVYLVAEEDHRLVGHLFLKFYGSQTEPGYPNMQDLYVDESKRSEGIGTYLIYKAEEIAKDNGYIKISLAVNPALNARAKALYEKLGYKQIARKPYIDGVYDGVEDWCVDMVKNLG
jgi:GNAT superfamily N-acetyltransferase